MTLTSKSVVVNNTIEGRIRYISKSLNIIFSKLDTMKPQSPFSLPHKRISARMHALAIDHLLKLSHVHKNNPIFKQCNTLMTPDTQNI